MGYTEKTLERLHTLYQQIQTRKEHERSAPTYKDAADLEEIARIVQEECKREMDRETLVHSITLCRFLADAYDAMGRFALSSRCYQKLFSLALLLKETYREDTSGIEDALYAALRARNVYLDDDCEDLLCVARKLMPPERAQDLLAQRQSRRRALVHDSVEMTEPYLSCIDAVEAEIEEGRTLYGMGSCHQLWELKRAALARRGIEWHSPAQLNPRMHFD